MSKAKKSVERKAVTNDSLGLLKLKPFPKTDEQKLLIDAIYANQVTFAHGPAGTGKSYVSTMLGVFETLNGRYKKIIITRPCVEAGGEEMGFLPGTLQEKLFPYLWPIINIIQEKIGEEEFEKLVKSKIIQMIPFAFMRGLTLEDSFVIVDEAQNTTIAQMRLILTRIGNNSKYVVSGDTSQTDIVRQKNGLQDAIERFQNMDNVSIVELTELSIVRSALIVEIERRYRENKISSYSGAYCNNGHIDSLTSR